MSFVSFSESSVRSVYIRNINYNCSLLANLNETMQTKQHAMKKPNPNQNVNKKYEGLIFVMEVFLAENFQNRQFY